MGTFHVGALIENHTDRKKSVRIAKKGDLALLGARTLEGLNLTVNPTRKKLVAAGPIPAA